jgi:hypothetical protein
MEPGSSLPYEQATPLTHIQSQIIPDYILRSYFSKSILILSFSCVCDVAGRFIVEVS